jgi:hypothetical protein
MRLCRTHLQGVFPSPPTKSLSIPSCNHTNTKEYSIFSSNNSHVSVALVSKHIEEERESRRRSEKEEKKVNQWRRSLKQRERRAGRRKE